MAKATAYLKRPSWYPRVRIHGGLRRLRRYPLLPASVLMVILIVPAIFANQLVPHDPRQPNMDRALLPPFWVTERVALQTAVETVDRGDRQHQIQVQHAQRMVNIGEARVVGATATGPVRPGDQIEIVVRRGGSTEHILGTDKAGMDILSRIIAGARLTLIVSLLGIAVAGAIGTTLGLVAGYLSRWLDSLVMRLVDVSLSLPTVLIALVLAMVLGPKTENVLIVIALILWSRYARLVRGETLSLKNREFIARARVAGASHPRVMIRHILPNLFNSIVVLGTLQIGYVVLLEASLSFLGAGTPMPNPAWGLMVAEGRELITTAAWVSLFPGVAILLTVLSANLLGDWLRDRLDPMLRHV